MFGGKDALSTRKMTVMVLEPFSGSATYVCKPPISLTLPVGLPSCKTPDMQQAPIPISVVMLMVFLGVVVRWSVMWWWWSIVGMR